MLKWEAGNGHLQREQYAEQTNQNNQQMQA